MIPPSTPRPTRGVPVALDRTRYLRYSLRTRRKIREEFGDQAMSEGLSDEKLAKMLYYGLLEDDPTITVDQIEDLVDLENLKDILNAVVQAFGGQAKVATHPPKPAETTTPATPSEAAGS